ncbi:mandelate racemase/muconate lactonizing enzyme family protein [Candidatus Lucifugimonas marina]|uniref:Mandelate racemase/muconate lactonizing enzyme family protein n=1 Tax=Candidatus Lucifugimonas marina TaxID=3038979 RepID=A0AAJ5ZGH5_9CHLR|nr:mandelate racemase/muconate lactonizing enzyme family protein [SAR202 cluster bacterium JH639]WFG36860.1 mandelate racemase/muconate lactonizing enzyme family protein [SAR202 cluster bacterium JH545]WFG40798.1 mandelate racemase/muconate lactonizing enzyme family protein [SAR202 cluster bacterium JH1073]
MTSARAWVVKTPWDNNPGAGEVREGTNRTFVFIQVDTDEGITGWGEITTYPGPVANGAIAAFVNQIGKWLVGENPEDIERIWAKIFRGMTYVGTRGATSAAISGIDIALWDIRGKALNQPVYKLLGGAVRDKIALYCHPPEPESPEHITESVKEIVASGHRAFKMDPMMHNLHVGNASFLDGEISAEAENAAMDIVAAAREAAGPDIEILIDAHGMYNVPTAIRLANQMAEWDIFWFEEPVPAESWKALKQVKEQITPLVSVGERLHTRWEFVPIFENGLADYIMPDVTWTGGITELKKIATMAEAYYVPISPHDASGPINVMSGAQVMMTVPNFYKLETSRYDLSGYDVMIDHPLDIREGDLYVTERPGIGVNLDPEWLAAHEVDIDSEFAGKDS